MAANVTNTVALVPNGVGSVWGSMPELRGQRRRLFRLIPTAAIGGAAGAALLLSIPAEGFENSVPVLLAASAVPDRPASSRPRRGRHPEQGSTDARGASPLAICRYGGFFGAAAGVLMLALFLRTDSESLTEANAIKNVILGTANAVAALVFIAFAPVHWPAVIPLGIGCLIGSRLGPVIVRHAPATPLRLGIAVAGMALAVDLGLDAYR